MERIKGGSSSTPSADEDSGGELGYDSGRKYLRQTPSWFTRNQKNDSESYTDYEAIGLLSEDESSKSFKAEDTIS